MVRAAGAMVALALTTPAAAAIPSQMSVDMIASTLSPRPGSTVLIGFRMKPKPGWHGYWNNAGGNGIAPQVDWTAPKGVKFGPLLHPAPSLFKSMGVVSFVHAGEHVLVVRATLPTSLQPGTALPIRADLSWAVCSSDLCVPGSANFSLDMKAGSGEPTAEAAVLARALAQVPRTVSGGEFWSTPNALTLFVPPGLRLRSQTVRFFPDHNGFFDAARARTASTGPLRIVAPITGTVPRTIGGVISDGLASYRLSLKRGAIPSEPAKPVADPVTEAVAPSEPPTPVSALERPLPERQAGRPPADHPDTPKPSAGAVFGFLALAAAALLILLRIRRRGS